MRVDSALYNGLDISYYYDPLIAKLCTWGRNRTEAIQRMRRGLREFKVVGVATNIPFHLQVMENAYFLEGKVDTSFVEKHFQPQQANRLGEERLALLAGAILAHRERSSAEVRRTAGPPVLNTWRLQGRRAQLARHSVRSQR